MPATSLSEARRKLLEQYLARPTPTAPAPDRITARESKEPAPLSLSQEQLYRRETSVPGIPRLYNECIALRMIGAIDAAVLDRSFAEIVRRHEIWRTSYDSVGGQPVQVVHPPDNEIRLAMVDLQGVPRARCEYEAQQVIGELVREPFDLAAGPLLRARLVRFGDYEHRLYLVAHLSIVDGVSAYQVFPNELARLYSAFSSGQPSPLAELSIQFGDYARWQRQWREGEEAAAELGYWRKQLAGELPVLSWPTDRPRPSEQTFRGATRPFMFPSSRREAIKSLSRQEGITTFAILLAAFAALLHRYTQQDDVIIGTPSPAGRKRSEVEGMLGYFLNPVALRFDLSGNPSFRELLRQTQRLTLEALSNDGVPIEFVARELKSTTGASRNPLFTVAVSLQPATPALDFDWSVTSMDVESGGAPWDLYIAFIDRPEGMLGRIQYNPDLFDDDTLARMLEHYNRLLELVSTSPELRLSQAGFLDSEDPQRMQAS